MNEPSYIENERCSDEIEKEQLRDAYYCAKNDADEYLTQLSICKTVLKDALSGWKYVRERYGDLDGVGWDRVQSSIEDILDA